MNETAIWRKACELMQEGIPEVSYDTWIDPALRPVGILENVFYLTALAEFHRITVANRYESFISDAIKQASGRQLKAKIISPEEANILFPKEPNAQGAPYALNPNYTFSSFVVGNSNRFAHAAAVAVAEAPAKEYNPLFIYGGVGLGKTHLMHAIGHFISEQFPEKKLLYITSENLTNELIAAIQSKKNVEFRERFRNVDVLMVDDIQFIVGRASTEEEFFHTFNTLHAAGKQIVISCDRPPTEIRGLESRLVSRFQWGLVADIQKPDVETRIAILRKKADREQMIIGDDDVLKMIAGRIDSNIRELEGALTRVVAYADLEKKPLTLTLAEEALRDILAVKDHKRITCELIQETVASHYNINAVELRAKRRNREVSVPRQIAMFLAREMTELSLKQIGTAFNRDHTTVIHACEKVAEDVRESQATFDILEDLRYFIRNK